MSFPSTHRQEEALTPTQCVALTGPSDCIGKWTFENYARQLMCQLFGNFSMLETIQSCKGFSRRKLLNVWGNVLGSSSTPSPSYSPQAMHWDFPDGDTLLGHVPVLTSQWALPTQSLPTLASESGHNEQNSGFLKIVTKYTSHKNFPFEHSCVLFSDYS